MIAPKTRVSPARVFGIANHRTVLPRIRKQRLVVYLPLPESACSRCERSEDAER